MNTIAYINSSDSIYIYRRIDEIAETLEYPASRKDGYLASDENIRIEQLVKIMRQCSLASQENN